MDGRKTTTPGYRRGSRSFVVFNRSLFAEPRDLVVPLGFGGRLALPRGVRLLPRAYVGRERLRGERRAGHGGGIVLLEPRRHRGPLVRVPVLDEEHGILEELRGDGTHEPQLVQVRRLVHGHGLWLSFLVVERTRRLVLLSRAHARTPEVCEAATLVTGNNRGDLVHELDTLVPRPNPRDEETRRPRLGSADDDS